MDATDAGEAAEAAEANTLFLCEEETTNIDTAADDIVATVKIDIAHEVKEEALLNLPRRRCREKQTSCFSRSFSDACCIV